MYKKYILLFVVLFLFFSIGIKAEPYSFLNYEIGFSGMNRTGSVHSTYAEAAFYNPALLANCKSDIMISYLKPFSKNFLVDSKIDGINNIGVYAFGISIPIKKSGFGINGILLKNNDIISYDNDGNLTGSFNSYEGAIITGYAIQFNKFSVGINNKIIYQSLYDGYNKTIGSIGFGVTKKVNKYISISGTADNLLSYKIKNNNMRYESPIRNYNIGINYQIGKFNLSGVIWSNIKDVKFSSAIEVKLLNWVSFSGGIKDGIGYYKKDNSLYSLNNNSIANIGLKLHTDNFNFGYAFGYQGILGIKHLFSIYYTY